MQPPLVSIIVPCYRHERYVSAALNSCARLEYENVELIIANDASPTDDDARIREWIERNPSVRTQYLRHESNAGIARTLNECLAVAHGSYVCILAGDDILLPHSVGARVAYLETHPDKLAVFSDSQVIDDEGRVIFSSGIEDLYPERGMSKHALSCDRLLPLEIVFHWSVPGPAFMARRELYEILGGYDESFAYEDWDMYLRIASVQKLGFLDDCTAQYRWHGSNYVKKLKEGLGRDHYRIAAAAVNRYRGLVRLYLWGYSWQLHAIDGSFTKRAKRAVLRRAAPHILSGYRLYRRLYLMTAQGSVGGTARHSGQS